MKTRLSNFSIFVACLGLGLAAAQGAVTLPSLLSNHAVLQRSDATQIWGKAPPGEKVKVSLGEARAETSAGGDGKWKVGLDVSRLGEGPFELIVEGANRLVVSDVVVGEVWVCGGQSNMDLTLVHVGEAAEELPQAANSSLRQFRVAGTTSAKAEDECKGAWSVATPETAKSFTAVGYFFGKSLQRSLHQPVGLIHAAVAGTDALSWLPQAAIAANPEWKEKQALQQKRIDEYPLLKEKFPAEFHQWEAQYGRKDHPADPSLYAATDLLLEDWKKVTLPAKLEAAGLPDSGAVWFRKKIMVPPGFSEMTLIQLGAVRQFNDLYLNGKKIKEITVESMRQGLDAGYYVPKDTLREGENTLAIRVFTPAERAGFNTGMYLESGTKKILLNGEWLAKMEFELPAMSDEMRKALPKILPDPGKNSFPGFFNAMIHPLMASTIQGVIWYQGEADAAMGAEYWTRFEAVIQGWRAGWGRDFAFYHCQLPNLGEKMNTPKESKWAEGRQFQSMARTLPNTGQAVLIDVGEEDIHPLYKKAVGERLARLALARTYKQKVVDSGPVYKSMKIEGDKVHLAFLSTAGGLVAKPLPAQYQPSHLSPTLKPLVRHSPEGELEGFAICGEDKKWVWATAKSEGDTVIAWSPAVPKPVAVRYAWADNPTCNLYNGEGLPASPFQTGN